MDHYPHNPDRRDIAAPNWWLLFALVFVIALLGWQTYRLAKISPLHDPSAAARPITPRGELWSDEKAQIAIYNAAHRSVVHVTSLRVRQGGIFDMREEEGTGSGFLWDEKGHVVTNFHVVYQAPDLSA